MLIEFDAKMVQVVLQALGVCEHEGVCGRRDDPLDGYEFAESEERLVRALYEQFPDVVHPFAEISDAVRAVVEEVEP